VFGIGPEEIILILVIALIVFGPKRLPEIGRAIGKSLREFRRASDDLRDELKLGLEDQDDHFTGGYGTTPPQRPAASGSAGGAAGGTSQPVEGDHPSGGVSGSTPDE
jgi:TatA/E family protein of Tat protein translocase